MNWISRTCIQTVKRTLSKAKLLNKGHYLPILILNSQLDENGLSPAHKLFNRSICSNLPSIKPQPKSSTIKKVIKSETQNRLSTFEAGNTARIRKDQLLPQTTALACTTS